MPKQFLLNEDGSIPKNANVDLLNELAIPLVLPTPVPRQDGMVAVEQEPEKDAEGVWRQVWKLEKAPDPVVESSNPLDSLTEEQKQALLKLLTS